MTIVCNSYSYLITKIEKVDFSSPYIDSEPHQAFKIEPYSKNNPKAQRGV